MFESMANKDDFNDQQENKTNCTADKVNIDR